MKRVVLRLAALVTVVVLGLIAIAQAQRGANLADDPPDAAASGNGQASAPGEIVPEPDTRPMPTIERLGGRNPLREGVIPTSGVGEVEGPGLAAPLQQAAGEAAAAQPEVIAGDGSPLAHTNGPGPHAVDPRAQADRAAGRRPLTDRFLSRNPPPPPGIAPLEESSGPAPLAGPPPRGAPADPRAAAAPGGFAAPPSATEAVPRTLSPPPASPMRSAAGADRTVDPRSDPFGDRASAGREPAPLALDPQASSTRIPAPSRTHRFDGEAESGATADTGAAHAPDFGSPRTGLADRGAADRGVAVSSEGTGRPGSKLIEGPQSPQVTLHKAAPPEVQVGKPATFLIQVINTGSVTASAVEVRDQIPRGMQLVRTNPPAQRGVAGELVWKLGAMQPGKESRIEVELMPVAEGELGSVATVHYTAEASARTVATKPELDVRVSAPPSVVIGEELTLSIVISNPGSGVATGVVLEEHVPAGFQHPAGTELEQEIGVLQPNESRSVELTLTAVRPGPYTNTIIARGEGSLRTEARQELAVVAPRLDVALEGPSRRYLEREATYTVSVSNPGSAPARDVELIAELPPGMDFVGADNQGHFEEATRTVHWRLAELPVNTMGSVTLTAVPIEAGQKTLRVSGTAAKVSPVQKEHAVSVEGVVAINFQVADSDDPIEKGAETTYEIRVTNQGSKTASNLQLEATLPPELHVVAAEGPVRHLIDANRVRFESLGQLAPKADTVYRVRVQGLEAGDLRMRVQLMADDMDRPVIKEESTRVYSDQ